MNTTITTKAARKSFHFTPLAVAALAALVLGIVLATAWYVTAPKAAAVPAPGQVNAQAANSKDSSKPVVAPVQVPVEEKSQRKSNLNITNSENLPDDAKMALKGYMYSLKDAECDVLPTPLQRARCLGAY